MDNHSTTSIDQRKPLTHKRSLAPDLARGFMLLLIALAHAPMYVPTSGLGVLNHPLGGSMLDNTIKFLTLLFVDLRSYPMFATLFGFGLAMMISRQLSKGTSKRDTKKLIYRRCLFLILFGILHAILVFSYDILSIYGIAGLIVGWLMFRSDRTILRGAAWLTAIIVFMLIFQAIMMSYSGEQTGAPHGSMTTDFIGTSILLRFSEYPLWIIYSLLIMPLLAPLLLGAWIQRRGLLDNPQQNQSFLKYVTIIGISISVIGGLPLALAGAQVWEPSPNLKGMLLGIHAITGMFGGLGYTAMFGLISLHLRNKHGFITQALISTGRRSLTCYLAQSIVLAILLSNWGFGIGEKITSVDAALIGIFIWILTILLAVILEKKGRKGPAEVLLRNLVNKKTST